PWPTTHHPRRAAISSFGISGTNAHLILEQAPEPPERPDPEPSLTPVPWPLAATNDEALRTMARRLCDLLDTQEGAERRPEDVGHSLATGRAVFGHRAVVVGDSREELLAGLRALAAGESRANVFEGVAEEGRTAFLFSGQGSQRARMGLELYEALPEFAAALDEVCGHFDTELERPLREVMFAAADSTDGRLLHTTAYTQPALFALETALFRLLESCGVTPDFVTGHSVGELTAAHVSGVLTLPDACRLVAARARLMGSVPGEGAMYAIEADEEELLSCVRDGDLDVTVAGVNSPRCTVISGDVDAVAKTAGFWRDRGRRVSRLRVSHAFHSRAMDPVLDAFRRAAEDVTFHPPRIPVVSNVTGRVASADELCAPEYWVRQLRGAVRFMDGVLGLRDEGVTRWVEVGPDAVLATLTQECLVSAGDQRTPLATARNGRPAAETLLATLARLHTEGVTVRWPEGVFGRSPRTVPLPTYPFRRRRHWLYESSGTGGGTEGLPVRTTGHALLGAAADLAGAGARWYAHALSADQPWYLDQHRVAGRPVLPGAATVEWALAAARAAEGGDGERWTLRDIAFQAFLPLGTDHRTAVQAVAESRAGGYRVRCFGRPDGAGEWTEHASVGSVAPAGDPAGPPAATSAVRADDHACDTDRLYEHFRHTGLEYGPAFRGVRRLRRRGDEALAEVSAEVPDGAEYVLDPVVLDACFQSVGAFTADDDTLWVPASVERIDVYGRLPRQVRCHVRRRPESGPGEHVLDLEVSAADSGLLVTVTGLCFRPVPRSALAALTGVRPSRLELVWEPCPEEVPPAAEGAEAAGRWLVAGTDPAVTADWHGQLAAVGLAARAATGAEEVRAACAGAEAYSGLLLHLPAEEDGPGDGDRAAAAARTAHHALDVLQPFLRARAAHRPTVVICSTGASAPRPGVDVPDPAQAPLNALARSVICEYPDLVCVQVDLAPGEPLPALSELLGRAGALGGSGHLAVREGRWYEERLREHRTPGGVDTAPPVRPDATYLVTGGLGGLGLATAEWLAGRGARTLVLAGRTLPEREPAAVTRLRERGVRVELCAADVSDASEVAALLARVTADLPALRGIVHAAGSTCDGVLEEIGRAEFDRVLGAKVRGAWELHRRTLGLDLDFFVLYSALAGMIGLPGQSAYLAGNAFLDALALYRRAAGLPALSVCWGAWAEAGMASGAEQQAYFAELGIAGMSSRQALTALAELGADVARAGVAAVDWQRHRAATPRPVPYTLLAGVRPAGEEPAATARPGQDVRELSELVVRDPEAARQAVLDELLARCAALLSLDEQEVAELRPAFPGRYLNEHGFDSLTTIQLRNQLLGDLSVDLSADFLFGGGTAAEIAEQICRQLTALSVLAVDDDGLEWEGEAEMFTL
ncbi:SDR family NAD(P)-dependent oxidoreductase, partial [Streptomyces sp. NPDC053367]|uniref:SDR family NAD(P)-dependent oxidoreductase n=1 Tax=Streptomyces sp. NPDC053367 TaxID=3365700 RepID=UPI0037D8F48C